METTSPDNKKFSLVKRAESFAHAGRGMRIFMKATHNARLHVGFFAAAVLLGVFFKISEADWLAVVLASGLVFVSEAFNSAIEVDIDLTSPEYHPQARDTKDIAAGAVLIAAATAAIVGLVVFGPHIAESLSLIP